MEGICTTKNSKLFLVMVSIQILAIGLSNVFVNVYFWNVGHSLTLLALYSLAYSIAVLISFPVGAHLARRTNPMWCMRVGILLHIATFALVILFKENVVDYIELIGAFLGLGVSFYVIGQHLQTLDVTNNDNRDRFLFAGSFLNNAASLIAPVVGGFVISRLAGLAGYYTVFSMSVAWFLVQFALSFRVHCKPVPKQSYLKEVWMHPTREWRRMFWVTMITATVDSTYSTFLVTIMAYTILQNNLSLGWFNSFVSLLTMITSLYLAKRSSQHLRLPLYVAGAILVSLSSILLSVHHNLVTLGAYILLSAIGFNFVNTMLDSWGYASIERDPNFEARKLDYIVIREVPIGIGRTVGIGVFLLLQSYFHPDTLSLSFSVFGSVYVLLIPAVRVLHEKRPIPNQIDSYCVQEH